MKNSEYFLLLLGISLTTVAAHRIHFFRSDYTYVEQYDAFYKLHWDNAGKGWEQSFLTCKDEGAMLFYPIDPNEWILVKNLLKTLVKLPNTTDVFVGIHNKYNLTDFITADGQSTPSPLGDDVRQSDGENVCVTLNSGTGKYKAVSCERFFPALYVCKRIDDKKCPTIDPGYIYSMGTNKCFKINHERRNWHDAMQTCFMEGGLLTVEEYPTEIGVIHSRSKKGVAYYVGVQTLFYNGDYYTVTGKKLMSGVNIIEGPTMATTQNRSLYRRKRRYSYWRDIDYSTDENPYYTDTTPYDSPYVSQDDERNPDVLSQSNRCGALYNNNIVTTSCDEKRPFICEMEANNRK